VIAHELGHAVLGHGHQPTGFTDRAATLGEWARLAMPRELEANARSVEILTRVKGWPEATSLRIVAEKLRSVVRAQQRGVPVSLGHLPACEELRDLLARFPQHQTLVAGWNCPV
jgi:hypothetical protein